jgi:hypothetical protein
VLKPIAVVVMCLAAAAALARGPTSGDEAPDDAQVAKGAQAEKSVAATTAVPEAMKLPPGFKEKKRGKHIVYCRTDTPIGTRFKQETCLDANQIHDYLIALQENKSNVDRIRSTCSSACACGKPGSC